MQLVTLDTISMDQVLETFNVSFADYAVPITLDRDQFERMQRRRGYRPELSVGAIENGRLVGISLTGAGTWRGTSAAYGSGTGVIPQARNGGVAGTMMQRAVELARGAGADVYLLEVLQQNEPARRAYERTGFSIVRELQCWELPGATGSREDLDSTVLAGFARPEGEFCSWTPSWQNSDQSLLRTPEPVVTVVLSLAGEPVGWAAVCPLSGDLPQFAVAPAARRSGIGRELMARARKESAVSLRIINTDASDEGTSAFIRALGGRETFAQYEMVRRIER